MNPNLKISAGRMQQVSRKQHDFSGENMLHVKL